MTYLYFSGVLIFIFYVNFPDVSSFKELFDILHLNELTVLAKHNFVNQMLF